MKMDEHGRVISYQLCHYAFFEGLMLIFMLIVGICNLN